MLRRGSVCALVVAIAAWGCGGGSSGTGGGGTGGTGPSTSSSGGASSSSSSSTGGGGAGGGAACKAPGDCPDPMNECVTRTCDAGHCGTADAPAGTHLSAQTPGDCQVLECDGHGATQSANDDTDAPDDDNPCTADSCLNGAPHEAPVDANTPCGTMLLCDGMGHCVGCTEPDQCPGSDDDCKQRTCDAGQCGVAFTTAGTPVSTQTPGDCQSVVCDGMGHGHAVADPTDVEDDANDCTIDACNGTTPTHTPAQPHTPCAGGVCDGASACVACVDATDCTSGACIQSVCETCTDQVKNGHETDVDCGGAECGGCALGKACLVGGDCASGVCTAQACAPVTVTATTPADGATGASVATPVVITFAAAVDPTSLVAQTAAGPCSGTVQLSLDGFASCVPFGAAAPVMSGGGAIATFSPLADLDYGTPYAIRVSGATDAAGEAVPAYTQASGFTTRTGGGCVAPAVVISQVYGGGGNAGALYKNDFVELLNRGDVAVDVGGWSIQYSGPGGTGAWSTTPIAAGTVLQPGAYFLVQEAAGMGGTMNLPAPDLVGTIALGATAGKVALVPDAMARTGACPAAPVVDLVGYGSANCAEGAAAPVLSNTTAALRASAGCVDTDANASDFTAAAPAPRNGQSPADVCTCTENESNAGPEADYCDLQSPPSLSVAAGAATPLVYARIYEAGVTEPAGASSLVTAEIGFGPISANPESQTGWQWFAASYNTQYGNDDEYQASMTAPAAPGTYAYAARMSLDGGLTWTYCDLDGAGSNAGLRFDMTQLGTMTVTP
ncbi:MAG TPA: lamin tail domain-containing protein [Minicystis sp.]|nr:lamin tail domain-containing protein [Minicystis sp.]